MGLSYKFAFGKINLTADYTQKPLKYKGHQQNVELLSFATFKETCNHNKD